MPDLSKVLARLGRRYGEPQAPAARGPFELVMWENACYLLSDESRNAIFQRMRQCVGMSADAIWRADRDLLRELAAMGGMHPEVRVERWLEIARITRTKYNGDLNQIVHWAYPRAKKALMEFPSIGEPGADKILMQCGLAQGLPLESNGLRVLQRVGFGRVQKNYAAAYRTVQEAIATQIPPSSEALTRAHFLLRQHGKETCKTTEPACGECCVLDLCKYGSNLPSQRARTSSRKSAPGITPPPDRKTLA